MSSTSGAGKFLQQVVKSIREIRKRNRNVVPTVYYNENYFKMEDRPEHIGYNNVTWIK